MDIIATSYIGKRQKFFQEGAEPLDVEYQKHRSPIPYEESEGEELYLKIRKPGHASPKLVPVPCIPVSCGSLCCTQRMYISLSPGTVRSLILNFKCYRFDTSRVEVRRCRSILGICVGAIINLIRKIPQDAGCGMSKLQVSDSMEAAIRPASVQTY